MSKNFKVTLGVIILIIVILGGGYIINYNGLVSAKENIESEQSNIDVQYKRRADLIPNLIETVKGYSAHETAIIDEITEARKALLGAESLTDRGNADEELTNAINKLIVDVENYPDLKADSTYLSLMDELEGTENRISVARRDYNEKVRTYNNKVIRFPSSIIAGMNGFEKCDYFEAGESDKENVKVDFSK